TWPVFIRTHWSCWRGPTSSPQRLVTGAGLRKVRRATARASLVQQLLLRNFAYQLSRGRVEAFVLLFLGQMLIRLLSAAGASFWHFCSHFCDSQEMTNVNPGVSNIFESQSAFGSSIVSEMYCFACGTILSAGTSSPSRPGTQPVSSNISEASATRRAMSSSVIVLRMIVSSMSDEVGRSPTTKWGGTRV